MFGGRDRARLLLALASALPVRPPPQTAASSLLAWPSVHRRPHCHIRAFATSSVSLPHVTSCFRWVASVGRRVVDGAGTSVIITLL